MIAAAPSYRTTSPCHSRRSLPAFPVRQRGRVSQLLLLILIGLLLAWYVVPEVRYRWLRGDAVQRPVEARGNLAADEQSTIEIFERSKASVVYISTRERVYDYWTRNVTSVPRGTGSGFVWDDQGHIVTNLHVIAGAAEALIHLSDGREYAAALVGASPAYDIAVLRVRVPIDAPPPVPVGTSADLRVGQKVFAIGNPFGLDWTLTTGIVSALDRSLPNDDGSVISHLIQTDAAINPGNSGGPLLDSAGRLIGINTAIFSPSGASVGVGFAVPVDAVNRVVPQLIAQGRYAPPSLGIVADESVNRAVAREFDVKGVAVLRVHPGSAAEAAGLRGLQVGIDNSVVPGDVIVAIDGRAVASVDDLLAALDDHRIGDKVDVKVWRDGSTRIVNLALQASGPADAM